MINYDHFAAVELRVATVLAAERIEKSEKLLKLQLDLGERDAADLPATRQIVSGIGKTYTPEELVNTQIIIVANLESRALMGIESQGMVVAAGDSAEGVALLRPDRPVPPGSKIK